MECYNMAPSIEKQTNKKKTWREIQIFFRLFLRSKRQKLFKMFYYLRFYKIYSLRIFYYYKVEKKVPNSIPAPSNQNVCSYSTLIINFPKCLSHLNLSWNIETGLYVIFPYRICLLLSFIYLLFIEK